MQQLTSPHENGSVVSAIREKSGSRLDGRTGSLQSEVSLKVMGITRLNSFNEGSLLQ